MSQSINLLSVHLSDNNITTLLDQENMNNNQKKQFDLKDLKDDAIQDLPVYELIESVFDQFNMKMSELFPKNYQ